MRLKPPRPSEVHVWSASLLLAADSVGRLRRELAPDEEARAGRMHTHDLARRFIVARAVLRRLLAAYLPHDAAPLTFRYGARGKPSLDAPVAAGSPLSFNLSHAADTAVYAIGTGRDLGIDVEATDRDVEIEGIARKVFSALECEALDALPRDERRAAFFRIWARKEAYVKAHGEGFGYPTRSFSVSHCADGDALIADDSDIEAPRRWRVIGLSAPPGFAAGLAAEGRELSVLRFDASALIQGA